MNKDECIEELNKRIKSKKWFKDAMMFNRYFWGEPFDINEDKIIFNRNCAIKIYEKYELKEWTKLDKYLIEIIDDILSKYNINKIGIVGDCVCSSYDENEIQTYHKSKQGTWVDIPKLVKDLISLQNTFGINDENEIIGEVSKIMAEKIDKEIMKEIRRIKND